MNVIKGKGNLQAKQEALRMERTRNTLKGLLEKRPAAEELAKRNVLHLSDIPIEETEEDKAKNQLAETKKLLSQFLLARPGQEQLKKTNGKPPVAGFTCGNCSARNALRPGDSIRCRECGYVSFIIFFVFPILVGTRASVRIMRCARTH